MARVSAWPLAAASRPVYPRACEPRLVRQRLRPGKNVDQQRAAGVADHARRSHRVAEPGPGGAGGGEPFEGRPDSRIAADDISLRAGARGLVPPRAAEDPG